MLTFSKLLEGNFSAACTVISYMKLKLLELDMPPILWLSEPHQRQFTALTSQPGTHPNPPNLGVSITWHEPSPYGDEIRCLLYIPYRAGTILASHKGLVPFLHLGMVRLQLTETLPNVSTLCQESKPGSLAYQCLMLTTTLQGSL